ncbi:MULTISPECIES: DNA topoisomerase IV subunit A [Priestia]|jgi:topoisomerase IV subunit A|uniref:DNA topoisomerase 4 subunit A n=2 Tax=Priestia TaxID=2800373 RepID=D5DTB8_PRIM1|nr:MULTISPECIES: DNA topoisomerase IV subunit A [Priestia]AVX08568.1 DNA topoisomerase IV subunit A [Bacillus sp. Y-01]KOP74719.1 DNA gyrase subunit A [Bacillus sp. FJAT-21351]KQU24080.1 DNA gyrase subunit A [Bacillus sp. Leaf75]KRF56013.1 DNA gyrase subunit A [Bacillus sp. Soil531]MBZ5479969.1 DNA topoisomerase IV subunit A [Bacillus sp. T_4]MCF6796416.1 DNA topoisomerase IV subunit A [Bacillus sp. ET1]MDH6654457.1 topoisomerase-4 subunit A [Bacillus sp. PvP124]MDP9575402.1 topoisomerase-4
MTQTERFLDLPLEDVLGDRFGRYSKYIIQERALPDARDGLKPVQRRILYAMHVDGNTAEKGFRKSAKTVGNVIGNYHPHGDSSVYDAMVRMSQEWKVRNVLIEMHGNNGSIDGDPPAAMRYTEARLSSIAAELLRDIDKQTVEFVSNFDDTSSEPTVLPAMFPNLLVNGSTGISAGYATELPPHHLGEVIDATIMRIDKPTCTIEELMTAIQGPDFPTGGIIQGVDGIKKAYETGKGKIIIRGKTEVESIRGGKQQIVITEIPFEVNKANLVKKMDELRLDKKVEGIAEVRDETDRTGLRIVVELKKDANAQGVLHYLYKNTDLQVPYNFNMVAIAKKRPKLMSLANILDAYIDHQREVVTNRSKYELQKAREREHIVAGLIKALSILDEVIATIRASKDKRDAKNNLIAKYEFTEPQAEAIVSLQLYRLTNTDITALQAEAEELGAKINELEEILHSEKKLFNVIKKELRRVKKQYSTERRSKIEAEIEEIKINLEVMVPSEEVMVTVTKDGYVKRTSLRSYAASNGQDFGMKDTDRILAKYEINTTETLLIFTNKGNYLYMPVHELPDIRWKDMGQHIMNIVPIDKEEQIVRAIPVKEFKENQYLLFFTKNGMVKKSELLQYKAQRYSKALVAVNLKGDDEVVDVYQTDGKKQVFIATRSGYGLRFREEEINIVGTRASGVKGINLKDDDYVVSGVIFDEDEALSTELFIATQRGAVKKTKITEFEESARAKRGLVMVRELKSNPHQIAKVKAISKEHYMIVESSKGQIEQVDPSTMRASDRYSNGSFVLDQSEAGNLVDVWLEEK